MIVMSMSSTVDLQINGPAVTVVTNICKPPSPSMCSCHGFVKEEIHPKNVLFGYLYPEDFIKFQCIKSVFQYLVWRSVWAIIFMFMLILNGTISDYWTHTKYIYYQWFTYLTHWTSSLLAVSSTIDVICVIHIYLHRTDIVKEDCRKMPWYVKINWWCSTISNNMVLLVTIIHWIFIYKGERVSIFTLVTYGGTALYVTLNVILVSAPVRIYHMMYPMITMTIYALCNFVYQESNLSNSTDSPKYPGWKTYYDIIYTDFSFVVGAAIVHLYIYLLYIVRITTFKYMCISNRTFIYWQPTDIGDFNRQDIRYTYLTAS